MKIAFSQARPSLLLCPFDNGIRCMQQFKRGVYGAAKAPAAIHSALRPFGFLSDSRTIPVSHLNTGVNADSYRAHDIIADEIAKTKLPLLVLGGDHSIPYPILKGIARQGKRLGVIYFDSHYDLRPLEGKAQDVLSSGNAFYRALTDGIVKGENLVAVGIHPSEAELFRRMDAFAKAHKMTTIYRQDLVDVKSAKRAMQRAFDAASKGTDGVYLSVDIDVLSSKYAPGASCPVPLGISLEMLTEMVQLGEVVGADISEVSAREMSWTGQTDPDGQAKLEETVRSAAEVARAIRFV